MADLLRHGDRRSQVPHFLTMLQADRGALVFLSFEGAFSQLFWRVGSKVRPRPRRLKLSVGKAVSVVLSPSVLGTEVRLLRTV